MTAVRDLRPDDWPAVRAIYEAGIRSGATFETEAPTWEQWDTTHPELRCVAERVVLVQALAPVTYANGDTCQYMDITFRCRAVGGEARVNDDESLEVGWFPVDALPDLNEYGLLRIKQALSDSPTWFDPTNPL